MSNRLKLPPPMKTHPPSIVTLAALTASALLLTPAVAEQKKATGQTLYLTDGKPAPAAAAPAKPVNEQPAPAKRNGIFDFLFSKKSSATPAPTTKPAVQPSTKPAAKVAAKPPASPPAKTAPKVAAKPTEKTTSKPVAAAEKPAPAKSGGILEFLHLKKRTDTPAAPETKATAKVEPAKTKPKADPVKPAPVAQAKTKPETKPEAKPAEAEKKPGFFARLFSGNSDDAKSNDKVDPANRPPRPADWKEKYIVSDDHVEAYRYGPSQSRGPDEYLSKGTIITLKKGGKAWSDIATESGHIFTVGTDQIRKAREDDFAPPPPPVIVSRPMGPDGSLMPLPSAADLEPAHTVDLPETIAQPKKSLDAAELLLPPLSR